MELVFPTAAHKLAVLDYRQEWLACAPGERIHGSWGLQRPEFKDYGLWLEAIEGLLMGQSNNPQISVPTSTYLALCGGQVVGNIQIRHELNAYLLREGGHIGYAIRPSLRRKGLGTSMLALALEKCRMLGMQRVLITVDKANIPSAKTALRGGAVLEDEVPGDDGTTTQRYWITL